MKEDKEVGDGTTSFVILDSELLRCANVLVQSQIHPTNIIMWYRLSMTECTKNLRERLATGVEELGRYLLVNHAKNGL